MKTLFKDEIIAKLRKLPTFVWYLFYAVSFFFRDAAALLGEGKTITESYRAAFEEIGMTGVNFQAMSIVIIIFAAIIATAIFELILWLAHSIIQRRFPIVINRNDFRYRVRLVFIISNIILGIIGIPNFFTDKTVGILGAIFNFAVPAMLLIWFYEDFRVRYVPKARQHSLFRFVAMIYIGIYLALSVINLIRGLVMFSATMSALDTVALCLDTVVIAAVAVVAYFDYRRLSKIALEPEDNDLFIKKEEKPNDDNIFKDLGF